MRIDRGCGDLICFSSRTLIPYLVIKLVSGIRFTLPEGRAV